MDLKQYINMCIEYRMNQNKEIAKAIEEQRKLNYIATEIAKKRWALQEKSDNLIMQGSKKFLEKYPQYKQYLGIYDNKYDNMKNVFQKFLDKDPIFQEISIKMKEIPELKKNDAIVCELMDLTYKHIDAILNLNAEIDNSRKKFFSKEYLEKMDTFADNGILLYYMETPDIPLIDPEIDEKIIIDSLLCNNCYGIEILLSAYLNCEYASDSMSKKQEDLASTMNLLLDGSYRAAARNLFALLDNEHKRAANAFNGYFSKEKLFKNGGQRAKEIEELVKRIDITWIKRCWNKANTYFKNITSTNPVKNCVHRNSIVHGDYESGNIKVDEYDIVKLILLWLNLHMIADKMAEAEDIYDNIPAIAFGISKEIEKSKTDNSSNK